MAANAQSMSDWSMSANGLPVPTGVSVVESTSTRSEKFNGGRIRYLDATDETPCIPTLSDSHLICERVIGRRNGDGRGAMLVQTHLKRVTHDDTTAASEPSGRNHMNLLASQVRYAIGAWMAEIEINLSQNILLKNRDTGQWENPHNRATHGNATMCGDYPTECYFTGQQPQTRK